MRIRPPSVGALLVLAALSAAAPARAEQPAGLAADAARVERLRDELRGIDERLQVVEKQYAYRELPGEREELASRYSDAEIQFLLNNHQAASVLLYDLVGSATFRTMREYPEALYMLAESLFQEGNLLGARLYFREHMNLRGARYREALARYLDISGRINEFRGIDRYIAQARGPDGALPEDIAYVYGKWLFRRTDLPEAERRARARAAFAPVADGEGAWAPQARYFLGVLALQDGDLEAAAQSFQRVLDPGRRGGRDRRVREQAHLALGRIYFELGRYDEALDRYQNIHYRSDYFIDALYEIAWTHVRRAKTAGPGEYEKASQACEKLLMAAPDSVLAPEARILQGHLLLKLGKYAEAIEAYRAIIDDHVAVVEQIDERLRAHPDPVQHFQQLISASGKTFDITALLPEKAIKWATTQQDVADAVRVTSDIDASRAGIAESSEIAARLLEILEKRQLEVFPQDQEGLARAGVVDSALTRVEGELLEIEQRLVGAGRPGVADELEAVRRERAALEERFSSLPKSETELEARRRGMTERINQIDQTAYQLELQIEGLFAVLAAVDKFVSDTRAERPVEPQEEKEYAERMAKEREVVEGLREELALLQKLMRDEKARLGLLGSGDAALREQYATLLERERELIAGARAGLGGEALALLGGIDQARAEAARLRERSAAAKQALRDAVGQRSEAMREKVRAEAALLAGYEREVARAAAQAQDLVGSIAFESVTRVRRQFYELVLKADVGLVDVAWTRKQDKTNQIQALARQKDKEVRALDEEFKEVLKEVE